jgi:phage terminase small subunit
MLEYIQFYTKNLSNFAILLLIGVTIAILDITLRNVVRDVYLNVRENMKVRHGGGREGMENKDSKDTNDSKDSKDSSPTGKEDDESCPKDCNAVEALRKKLTVLIENAAKLQKDIQTNNDIIKTQHKTIENMQKNVQKLIEKSK